MRTKLRETTLIALCLMSAFKAYALTPQEIYRQVERQVLMLEELNDKGEIVSFHTALLVAKDKAAAQCSALSGTASLRLRKENTTYAAKVVSKDSIRNLCLLAVSGIEYSNLYQIAETLPDAGARVYAVSNALGMGISISEGVLSAVRVSRGESFIQFTAAISPGSEGGGLFDADGRLLGVIDYRPWGGQNINFAMPARWIQEIGKRASSSDVAEAWRARAPALRAEAKWQELAELGAQWSKTLPDSIDGWLWLGFGQEQLKNWPEAEKAYRMALQLEPSATAVGIRLATVLTFQKKAQEALETANALLPYNREDAEVWLTIAYIQLALEHMDEARKAFGQAVKFDPLNQGAYIGLGNIARAKGEWAAAAAAYRQVVSLPPQDAKAWLELSGLYLYAGRAERALASAERAIDLAPDNGDAWIFKGGALSVIKRYQEAITALKKGLASKPQRPGWGWTWLGDTYYELHLYPESIDAFREALRLEPNDNSIKSRLGISLKDGGRLEEALALFEKLKNENPSDPLPWRQIGFVNSIMGQSQKAIPALEKSLSLDPKQAKVWHALMEAYHAEGRREDVKRAYQKLQPLDQTHAEQAYRSLILPYGVAP